MAHAVSRRSLIVGSAALLAGARGTTLVAGAAATPVTLTAGRRTIEVKGRAARLFSITQPDGTSGLTLQPGDRFLVDLVNEAARRR